MLMNFKPFKFKPNWGFFGLPCVIFRKLCGNTGLQLVLLKIYCVVLASRGTKYNEWTQTRYNKYIMWRCIQSNLYIDTYLYISVEAKIVYTLKSVYYRIVSSYFRLLATSEARKNMKGLFAKKHNFCIIEKLLLQPVYRFSTQCHIPVTNDIDLKSDKNRGNFDHIGLITNA